MLRTIHTWFPKSTEIDYEVSLLEEVPEHELLKVEFKYINSRRPTLNVIATRTPRDVATRIFTLLACGKSNGEILTAIGTVSESVIKDIRSLRVHTYLHEDMPDEYNAILLQKEKSTKYLINTSNRIVEFTTIAELCRAEGTSQSGVSNVLAGRRKSTKGWRLPTEEELTNHLNYRN